MRRRPEAQLAASAAVALTLVLAGCGSSSKKAATDTAGGATTVAAASPTTEAAGEYGAGGGTDTGSSTTAASGTTTAAGVAPAANNFTVSVASVGKLGNVLIAKDGHTLYLFEKDNGTSSACTGKCAAAWPAYTSPNQPTAGAGVTASMLSTATGAMARQVVYNGHLLYEFSADKKPGDANGTGIPSWYPVNAAGKSVE